MIQAVNLASCMSEQSSQDIIENDVLLIREESKRK